MRLFLLAAAAFAAFSLFPAGTSAAEGPLPLVVLDPGHGGEDTGALGPSGIQEKAITLGVAERLARLLEETGWRVLLTRTGDVFIPLEERTAFANRSGADLFVSIHANAAPSRDARGIETFFLSMDSTDEDARRVAAFENSSGLAGGSEAQDAGDLKEILLDLVNTRAHHESSRLAEVIHMSMLAATRRENRGVKQAPFTVLVGATMPAVLVEVGFISNPAEERWLSSRKDQERIARSIAEGIMGFSAEAGTRGVIKVSGVSDEE